MPDDKRTVAYQQRVAERMIAIYCRGRHGSRKGELCPLCTGLRDYTRERLEGCPFGNEKPNCSCCTVHCYHPRMRERIRDVMRYSGPRMLFGHPWNAIVYLFRKRRKVSPCCKMKAKTPADARR